MRSGPLRIGQDFGPRYHVLKLLGSGGMGVVYQALDRELGEDIALKVLRAPARAPAASVAEMQRRFRAELVLARKVTHKHVIRIHDIGEIDGIKFISMPLVKGRDLAAMLADGPLSVERALRYARQIIAGLMAVHAAGVIHRDLKPSNIMVGDDDQVLLMDFGIARASAPAGQPRTIAGAVVGTTAYMAPEQARGESVDQRTDVYGFGLILYEMLSGIRRNLTINELLGRMKAPPPPPRQLNPAVSPELDAIVTRCLKPAAAERYQTSGDVAAALGNVRRGRKRRGVPPLPLNASLPRVAALLAIAALAGFVYWLASTEHGTRAIEHAKLAAGRAFDRVKTLNPASLLATDASDASAEAGSAPSPRHAASRDEEPAGRGGQVAAAPTVSTGEPALRHRVQVATVRFAPLTREPGLSDARAHGAAPGGPRAVRPDAGRALRAPSVATDTALRGVSTSEANATRRFASDWRSRAERPDAVAGTQFLPLVTPARQSFTLSTADAKDVSQRGTAPATRRTGDWLDRLLPVRAHRVPTPADAEDEFQVCYIQNEAS